MVSCRALAVVSLSLSLRPALAWGVENVIKSANCSCHQGARRKEGAQHGERGREEGGTTKKGNLKAGEGRKRGSDHLRDVVPAEREDSLVQGPELEEGGLGKVDRAPLAAGAGVGDRGRHRLAVVRVGELNLLTAMRPAVNLGVAQRDDVVLRVGDDESVRATNTRERERESGF